MPRDIYLNPEKRFPSPGKSNIPPKVVAVVQDRAVKHSINQYKNKFPQIEDTVNFAYGYIIRDLTPRNKFPTKLFDINRMIYQTGLDINGIYWLLWLKENSQRIKISDQKLQQVGKQHGPVILSLDILEA